MPILFAAAIIASIGVGIYQNNQQVKAQNKLRKEQEKLRVDSIRAEVSAQEQQTGLALGNAASRNKTNMQPSFASAALVGNQSSNTAGQGSSGTF